MAIINFENIVGDDEVAEIPDGYRDLNWKNVWAIDDELLENANFPNAIHSGEAAAYNILADPIGIKSPDRDDDFGLNSGFFTAAFLNDLKVTVIGFDDGERVARKVFTLDTSQEFVTFGPKFDDIDKVMIQARGSPDPGDISSPQIVVVDDLFLNF